MLNLIRLIERGVTFRKSNTESNISPRVTQKIRLRNFSSSQRTYDKAYCFGKNTFYQCHYEEVANINTPTLICGIPSDISIVDVTANWMSSFLILENEQVYCWGTNEYGQLGLVNQPELRVKFPTLNLVLDTVHANKIRSGRAHTLVLSKFGQMVTFGNSEFGQFGNGIVKNESRQWPQLVESLSGECVISISTGLDHNLALTRNGIVYAWGLGHYGQLGQGNMDALGTPAKMNLPKISSIECGADHSVLIDENGYLWGCGSSECGQLNIRGGDDILMLPERIGQDDVVFSSVACGGKYSLALTDKGQIWGCGKGPGVLVQDEQVIEFGPLTWFAERHIKIMALTSGFGHVLAISDSGILYGWGFNSEGQLGLGDKEQRLEPTVIEFFCDKCVKLLASGVDHTVVVTKDI